MPFPVLLALTLVAAVAVVVFLSARRRLSTWLILAAIGLIVAGGFLRTTEHSRRNFSGTAVTMAPPQSDSEAGTVEIRVRAVGAPTTPTISHPNKGTVVLYAPDPLPPVDTGSGPNHLPSLIVLALGAAVGLAGLVMKRRNPAPERAS